VGKSAAQREKEIRRAARLEATQAATDRRSRRKRIGALVLVFAIGGMFLATVIGGLVSSHSSSQAASDTTTTAVATTLAPPASLAVPAKGASITGATPCPAADGSAKRVTAFAQAPPMCIDPAKQYEAILHTTEGDITVSLSTASAPRTVNNFIVLSRYHFYDGVPFFRIQPQTVAITGDATGQPSLGEGGPGYTIPAEIPKGGVLYPWGAVAMWNETKDANGSRFFVVTGNQASSLPSNFTVFGLVTDGAAPMHQIDIKGDPTTGSPIGVVKIKSVDIREHPVANIPTTTG